MAQQEFALVEMDETGDGTNWNELDTEPCLVGLGLGVALPVPLEHDGGSGAAGLPEPGEVTGDIRWHDDMIWSGYLQ